MTPPDFFLWGYLKSLIYDGTVIHDLPALKNRIHKAFRKVTLDQAARSIDSYKKRLEICLKNDGKQVEIYKRKKNEVESDSEVESENEVESESEVELDVRSW